MMTTNDNDGDDNMHKNKMECQTESPEIFYNKCDNGNKNKKIWNEKKGDVSLSLYNNANTFECLPCAEGCDSCKDASPCVAALNWPMRTSILALACAVIGFLPPAAWFTFRYQQVKVSGTFVNSVDDYYEFVCLSLRKLALNRFKIVFGFILHICM